MNTIWSAAFFYFEFHFFLFLLSFDIRYTCVRLDGCNHHHMQPSIKFILEKRANELSPDRICGIVRHECSNNPNIIDFKIKVDREPLLKVNILVFHKWLIYMVISIAIMPALNSSIILKNFRHLNIENDFFFFY